VLFYNLHELREPQERGKKFGEECGGRCSSRHVFKAGLGIWGSGVFGVVDME